MPPSCSTLHFQDNFLQVCTSPRPLKSVTSIFLQTYYKEQLKNKRSNLAVPPASPSRISRAKGPDEKVDPGKPFLARFTKMETPDQLPQKRATLAQMKNSNDSGGNDSGQCCLQGQLNSISNKLILLTGMGKFTPTGIRSVPKCCKFGTKLHFYEERIIMSRSTEILSF